VIGTQAIDSHQYDRFFCDHTESSFYVIRFCWI
jgi:hypothetical protein